MKFRSTTRAPRPALIAILSLAGLGAGAGAGAAQVNETVARAVSAFDSLDYRGAIDLAQSALREGGLSEGEMAAAYEVLGYSYGILDDQDQAVASLSQMVVLDPDREPDRVTMPPRIVGLYDQAFERVLVVKNILVDSTSFVSGEGLVTLHYEVSRPANTSLRIMGNGVDAVIDSTLARPGPSRFDWDGTVEGFPVPQGEYRLLISAADGRNSYQREGAFRVGHAEVVDTTAHSTLADLAAESPTMVKQPEMRVPPREWRPLGIATVLTGAAAGAALALNNSNFEGGGVEISLGAVLTLGSGLWLSLRQPEPRPVPEAIQLNQVIDQVLLDRNTRIIADNLERRQRIRLIIAQVVQ